MVSTRLRQFLLTENNRKNRKIKKVKRKVWVHAIYKDREVLGEFHHLYFQLREFPIKFYEYSRMQIETFDYILSGVQEKIQKLDTNFRKPISPTERLFVTIRYASSKLKSIFICSISIKNFCLLYIVYVLCIV